MNAPVTPLRTEAERQIAERASSLPFNGPLAGARRAAVTAIEANGLPNRRVEAWKYTDLRGTMKLAAAPAGEPGPGDIAAAAALPGLDVAGLARVDIVNGFPQALSAMPQGIEAHGLAEALARGDAFCARIGEAFSGKRDIASDLNLAFLSDGLLLRVPAGTRVEAPLHLAFADVGEAPFATFPRIVLVVGAGASLTLVESHRGAPGLAYQSNVVVECVLEADAKVEHVRLNLAGDAALSLSTMAITLDDRAQFDSFCLSLGGQTSRYQIFTGGKGEDIRLGLRGGTLIRGSQHADVTLHATHAATGGTSRELFKTVVDDAATGVFQGKIVVDSVAQKTDGRMHSAALLLAENASMNNKPELEIFADDVQCGHGATVGALDEDLLFYALARGIPRPQAEALLIESFIGEAVEHVSNERVRGALMDIVRRWLGERRS